MVVIYGSSACVWCDRAIQLADNYNLAYEYKSVDNDTYKQELKESLPDVKTIPQIWWHGRHIGGHDDFVKEIENTIINFGQDPC